MKPRDVSRPSGNNVLVRNRKRRAAFGSVAVAIGVAGSLVMGPVSAQSLTPAAGDVPIRVERCAVLSRSELPDPFNGLRDERVSGLSVVFVNVRAVAATLVYLTVRYQASSETVVARGTFDPNVPIGRTFASFAGNTAGSDAATCTVAAATFRDGSTWSADGHPVPRAARVSFALRASR